MTAKLSISVGSVTVNGQQVGSISGFAYEGPAEGLGSALRAHQNLETAVQGAPPRSSTWSPTQVQVEALQAIVAAGGIVHDKGKRGCFAGSTRIKRVTFEVFRGRGLLADGEDNTLALTAAGRALAEEVGRAR